MPKHLKAATVEYSTLWLKDIVLGIGIHFQNYKMKCIHFAIAFFILHNLCSILLSRKGELVSDLAKGILEILVYKHAGQVIRRVEIYC